MKLSIIIPVFNEETTILEVLERVDKTRVLNVNKEIIVVDDGSTDSTLKKVKNSTYFKKIKLIEQKRNSGKGSAVGAGIKKATGEYILIQDADLEYHPNFINRLIDPVRNGNAKVVYGTRLNRLPNLKRDEKIPLFLLHYFGNRFLSLITSLLYLSWLTDIETCYKLFPKKAVLGLNLKAKRFDFEPEITAKLLKKGYKILEVPISTVPRDYKHGKKLNTFKDGTIALVTLLKERFVNE